MNYYDEGQEQYEEIAIQAIDNMPLGAVIDYSGNDVPVGWEKINDYSTTETNTGKTWIDGKPIYRKVISSTLNGTYTESGVRYTWINSSLSNVNVIKVNFVVSLSDRVVVNTESASITNASYIISGNNANKIQIGSNTTNIPINTPITLIVEYTKTS